MFRHLDPTFESTSFPQPNFCCVTVSYQRDFGKQIVRIAATALVLLSFLGESRSQDRKPIELTEAAKQLHASSILFDGHNDLPWAFREMGTPSFDQVDIAKSQPKLHTDIPRLKQGGVKAQFWSVYVPSSTRLHGEALQATLEQIDFVHHMIQTYPDTFRLCLSSAEIDAAIDDGKIASLIGMEGGHSIENSISVLRRLYKQGARYMTLTHSATLDWADSATDDAKHGGLTEFGEEIVLEMNRLGMLVDLSHVSDDTMRDAMRVSKAPVIYSHSSARAIGNHPRNVPDDILPLVKKNNGVIMVNFYPGFISPAAAEQRRIRDKKKHEWETEWKDEIRVNEAVAKWDVAHPMPRGSIHDVVDHIEHLIRHCGIDHVGIGSDYDGIGSVPVQLDDVSTYPLITQAMLDRGYTADDIHKVMGQNILRVFREAEAVAAKLQAE